MSDNKSSEKAQETRIRNIISAMTKAGPLEASSAMVLYSDLGEKEAQAVMASAAKIISESNDTAKDLEEFTKLVDIFKNEG